MLEYTQYAPVFRRQDIDLTSTLATGSKCEEVIDGSMELFPFYAQYIRDYKKGVKNDKSFVDKKVEAQAAEEDERADFLKKMKEQAKKVQEAEGEEDAMSN